MLTQTDFAMQSRHMENDWASQNLQTIRLLMERSSVYRRTLAPIMVVTGGIGLTASIAALMLNLNSAVAFTIFWTATSFISFISALLLVRRQALQDAEPFWSLPTRRVWQALLPNFLVGFFAGLLFLLPDLAVSNKFWILPPVWMLFYGCALHSAGFFMQRSIKMFGWVFVVMGLGVLIADLVITRLQSAIISHYVMGAFFGVLHLGFGIYLFCTEKTEK